MNANRKLTSIIKGRKISNISQSDAGDAVDITFDDNSKMHIKTSGQVAADSFKSRTVSHVQQEGTILRLVDADNTSIDIPLHEATSSVMLRDKDNKMQYAD